MAERETSVRYKALADFAALNRTLRAAKRNIAELRKEEERLNATTAAGEEKSAVAVGRHSKARDDLTTAVDKETSAVQKSTVKFVENAKAIRETATATEATTKAQESLSSATEATTKAQESLSSATSAAEGITRRARREQERASQGLGKAAAMTRRQTREVERLQATQARATTGVNKFYGGLKKLENWRPRLTPPFVVLIPLIAGVLALVNPLVAGIGALAAAGFGLASSFGSAASVLATGLIPGIATAIGLVAALKTAFGGIGGAFKAAGAMRDAAGGGGGGTAKAELSAAEKLSRAQRDLAEATQDVLFAEDDLSNERRDYIRRLDDLTKAVQRAALAEARAAANSQLARENYANILADPGSTKGQKMDAAASVTEARADYNDVLEDNKRNQAELLEMQQKGIEGDRQVIMATRALADAMDRQRDSQIALANEQSGANAAMAGGASAASEYQKMLAKLSPSARRFVETLVGLQDQWEAVKRTVQESFFSEVDGTKIAKYFEPVQKMLSSISGAAGRVFDKFLTNTTSPKWLEDIVIFGDLAAPVVETIGDGLLSILDVFKDLTIAAMPFLQELSNGFKQGAADFAVFIANGREGGTIAAWLERGRARLSQWWRIIKNIGKTLYNYGVAAAPFADWITQGLEDMTEAWLGNSEAARTAGSPFQKYLEDIKPLLTEMRKLVGDFFGWIADEAMDPENIKQMTEIFRSIREDIGPDIKRIFDAMSDAKIGPKLIETFGKITELIATVLENGGSATLVTFFDIVSGLINAFTALAASPGGGAIITTIGIALAGMAALSFVGQFSGLTSLLGLVLKFSKGGGLKTLSKIGSLLRGTSGIPATPGGAGAPGGAAAPKAGMGGTLLKAGGWAAVIAAAAASVGQSADSTGKLSASVQDGSFADGAVVDSRKGIKLSDESNREAGSALAYTGTPILGVIQTFLDAFFPELGTEFRSFISDTSSVILEEVTTFFTGTLPTFVRDGIAGIQIMWDNLVRDVKTLWNGFIGWLTGLWNGFVGGLTGIWNGFVGWLRGVWNGIVVLAMQFVAGLQTGWNNFWAGAGAVWDTFKKGFTDVVNGVIGLLNKIPGVNIPLANAGAGKSVKNPVKGVNRANGGSVPGSGNSDSVPAMLTPGEVVMKTSVVSAMGSDNADRFGRGLMSYGEMLQTAMASQPGNSKREKKGGSAGVSFLSGGGLVSSSSEFSSGNGGAGGKGNPSDPKNFGPPPSGGGSGFHVENLTINNPTGESAPTSIARTVRKVSYLGAK